jgi:hypothetical protein
MLFVFAHGALLLAWPVVLAQDGPLWISEAALLHAFFQSHLANGCHLVAALPPNAVSQGVIGALCWIIPAELAGRLYLVACVGLFAAALVYLCRARAAAGRQLALLCCLPLCVGYPLFHGFLNYMAALPALCWGTGYLLRNPEGRGWRGTCLLLVMPLLTYLCHGTAVGVWAVLVIMQLFIGRSGGFALRALPGFVPVLWLIGAYIAQRSAEGARLLWSGSSIFATILYRLRSPLRFLSVFPGFVPTFADPALRSLAPLLLIVNVGYAVAIIFYGFHWAWRSRRSADPADRWLSSSLLVLAGLFVIMPHDVANMLNPAERLVLPAACLAIAGAAGAVNAGHWSERRIAWMRYALCALLCFQWTYLAVWGTQAAALAHAFVDTRERYEAIAGVRVVEVDEMQLPVDKVAQIESRLPSTIELLTHHQVLLTQGTLEDWVHGRAIVPSRTGIFRCPAAPVSPTDLAALRSDKEILLLIGEPARAAAIARALQADFRIARPGPGFWTLVPSHPIDLRSRRHPS